MKFGIFDHVDHCTGTRASFYEARLELIEAYDRAGIHGYWCAEHHATPLGMASSPSVFLAAVAQRTRRLRFGPMVYQLNLYHPLRLIEEICMLDQLSGGRFEFGIGRGVNPIELSYFGIDAATAEERYHEIAAILRSGIGAPSLNYEGRFFRFKDVPLAAQPLQRPAPPMWVGTNSAKTAARIARDGVNIGVHAPPAGMRRVTDAFRAAWHEAGRSAAELPFMALTQHLVVAETDAAAREVARRAYLPWRERFYYLHEREKLKPIFLYPATYDEAERQGYGIAGAPDTVRSVLSERLAEAGANYLFCRFAFGDQALEETLRSLTLFTRNVMPLLAGGDDGVLSATAHAARDT